MIEQLEFNFLKERENYSVNDFLVFSGNKEAFCFLNQKDIGIVGVIFLIGEKKSGKTYLANIWKNNVNAKFIDYNSLCKMKLENFNSELLNCVEFYENYIIDDLDFSKLDENKFFHLLNIIQLKKSNLLVTTCNNVSRIKFDIGDLKSRVNSAIKIKIGKINSEIKYMLFLKLFSDKKVILKTQTAKYIFKFAPDNYVEMYDFINNIIFTSKSEKSKITIPFFKKILNIII